MRRTRREVATEPLDIACRGTDASGKPTWKVHGMKLFYWGRACNGDHVWQAQDEAMQLVFVGPDYAFTDLHIGLENLLPVGRVA